MKMFEKYCYTLNKIVNLTVAAMSLKLDGNTVYNCDIIIMK